MSTPIHLNTAGAGLMSERTVKSMMDVLSAEQRHGAYETESARDTDLNRVYRELALLLGADPNDIALYDSATRAWCATVGLLAPAASQRIIITPYEYAGNLLTFDTLRKRHGFRIETMPLLGNGDLDLDWLVRTVDDDVALVSVPYVPSGCGIVNPVAEIGEILAGRDCLYAVDACQAVGQLPVDVTEIGCDLLTGAGRKFLCGPRGTGFAVATRRFRQRLHRGFTDLHVSSVDADLEVADYAEGARVLELAERSTAVTIGLLNAVTEARESATRDNTRITRTLAGLLDEVGGIEVIAPGEHQSGIVSFRHDTVPAPRITAALRESGVNVWNVIGWHTPQYLLGRDIPEAVRASVHWYTTMDDLDALVTGLRRITA